MQNLGAFLTTALFIAAQSTFFDKPAFKVGGSFTVTCDVNLIGNVPADIKIIQILDITRMLGSEPKLLVVYAPFYTKEPLKKYIPTGRKWEIKAFGGRGDVHPDHNRETIKITLHVTDAQCSDAGNYVCKATIIKDYFNRTEQLHSKSVPVLKLDYHKMNAALTCYFEGIEGLSISWSTRPVGGANLLPYPSNDDIKMVTPTFSNETFECGKYVSTLTFKPPDVDTFYVCVVKDGDKEISRNSYKFIVKAANKGTPMSTTNSTWFVRTMFLVIAMSAILGRP